MKNLTKLLKNIPKTIELGLAGAVLCGTMGCATMTPAQKTALLGQSLSILGSINTPNNNTVEGNRAKEILKTSGNVITNQTRMQHDLEYANAGKSEIIINNNVPNNQVYANNSVNSNYASKNNPTPEGFFVYTKYVDFAQDGIVNGEDVLGMNQQVYNLNNLDVLNFAFFGGGIAKYGAESMDLKIYDLENGNVINYFNDICKTHKVQNFACEKESFPKSGKYRAVLKIGDVENFFIDFEVIK
jgi:hypothetical protein